MKDQLLLNLPVQSDLTFDSFLPMPSNQRVFDAIYALQSKQAQGMCVLYGEKSTGKTHLLQALAYAHACQILEPADFDALNMKTHVYLVDDIHHMNLNQQENLFHAFNAIKAHGGIFVVSSAQEIDKTSLIPELRSRLLTLPQYHLELPQTEALEMLCVKLAYDRQLQIEPKVIRYLVTHIGRRVSALQEIIALLDTVSLRDKRKITIALVRELLQGRMLDVS